MSQMSRLAAKLQSQGVLDVRICAFKDGGPGQIVMKAALFLVAFSQARPIRSGCIVADNCFALWLLLHVYPTILNNSATIIVYPQANTMNLCAHLAIWIISYINLRHHWERSTALKQWTVTRDYPILSSFSRRYEGIITWLGYNNVL